MAKRIKEKPAGATDFRFAFAKRDGFPSDFPPLSGMNVYLYGTFYSEQNAKVSVFDHGLLYTTTACPEASGDATAGCS